MNKNDLTLTKLFVIPSDAAARLEGKTFVGIDFGTSTTVVSVTSYDDVTGMINSVSLQIGQKTTDGVGMTGELVPSVIALNEDNGKLLVGEGAYQLKGNPDYSLGDNIWLMTYPFPFKFLQEYLDDACETAYSKHWSDVTSTKDL